MTITREDRREILDIVRALRRRGYHDAGYVNRLGDRDEVTGLSVYALPGNTRAPRLNLGYTVSYAPCRIERYHCIEYDDAVKGVSADSALAVYLNRLKGVPAVGDDGVPDQVAGLLRARRDLERRGCRGHKAPRVNSRWAPTAWGGTSYALETPDRVLCLRHPWYFNLETWYFQIDWYQLRRLRNKGSRQSHGASAENCEFLTSFSEIRGGSGTLDEAVEAFAHCWHELYHVPARKRPAATR